MKKLKNFALMIFVFLALVVCVPFAGSFAKAEEAGTDTYGEIGTQILNEISAFVQSGVDDSVMHKRFAGTDAERSAGLLIKSRLEAIAGLEAVQNISTKDGVQAFDASYDGKIISSQNIVFKKSGTGADHRKVVIATHYDAEGFFVEADEYKNIHGNEGVAESGAGVGLVITLAEKIAELSLAFDVEFVFFGANYAGMAGAEHYSSLISDADAEKILLMINFDKVVSSGDIFLYQGEYKNGSHDYLVGTFNEFASAKDAWDFRFVANDNETSVTGLPFTTIALESSSAHFLRRSVKILNVMAIDNDCVNAVRIVDYVPSVGREKDTISGVKEACGNKFVINLERMAKGVLGIIADVDFEENVAGGIDAETYEFFGNHKLAVFIVAVCFILMWLVASFIKAKLSAQAEEAKKAVNFDAVMAEVSAKNYESIDELVNEVASKIEEMSNASSKQEKNTDSKDVGEHNDADQKKSGDDKNDKAE